MGLLDRFRRLLPSTAPNGQPVEYRHFSQASDPYVLGLSVEELWRTQPYLRTVVTFLARNIAQLGLHSFERVSDTDRQRLRVGPVPALLGRPNKRQTSYELVYSLVADLALYDEAYWFVAESTDTESGWTIEPIPPSWITARGGGSLFDVAWFDIQPPAARNPQRVAADQFLVFRGWNPDDLTRGSTPVAALKQILAEQMHAQSYRQQIWERGGRVGAVLSRPSGTQWSDDARSRFAADWKAKWAGDDGPKAGGTPILEDGMTLQRVGFSAHEDEWVDAAKLSLSLVASAYHVNPTMVGVLDNANFSNVREFRRMLYGDTLGPTMAMIEDRINGFLLPRVTDQRNIYVEFNINEKLQGSFEEQAAAMQSATGAPWLLRSEARARQNLPNVPGMDEPVIPLNVLIGGQASPQDAGSQNVTGEAARSAEVKAVTAKARPPETYTTKAQEVLSAFFKRQAKVVKSRLGAKADADWWDTERWDTELAADLYRLAVTVSAKVAADTLDAIGFGPDAYDADRTLAFLKAVSERLAGGINAVTKAQIDEALTDDEPMESVGRVFEVAETSRSSQAGVSTVTLLAGFATTEAAKQVAGDRATKTWVTTSGNPRSSHSRMNGETVGIDEEFSNGAKWPGDGSLDIDETAGCRCDVRVNIP